MYHLRNVVVYSLQQQHFQCWHALGVEGLGQGTQQNWNLMTAHMVLSRWLAGRSVQLSSLVVHFVLHVATIQEHTGYKHLFSIVVAHVADAECLVRSHVINRR